MMDLRLWGCALLFPLQVLLCVLKTAVRFLLPQRRKDLATDVVLITGGGRGIGRHLAREFAKQGARKVPQTSILCLRSVLNARLTQLYIVKKK